MTPSPNQLINKTKRQQKVGLHTVTLPVTYDYRDYQPVTSDKSHNVSPQKTVDLVNYPPWWLSFKHVGKLATIMWRFLCVSGVATGNQQLMSTKYFIS